MCIRDRGTTRVPLRQFRRQLDALRLAAGQRGRRLAEMEVAEPHVVEPVSYTHLRAHETVLDLVCRLLLEKTTSTNK